MTTFTLGQRWISTSETELGLGIIVETSVRQVTLLYPASNQERFYSIHDAPLVRVHFDINTVVQSVDGWSLRVDDIQDQEGLLVYIGTRLDTNEAEYPLIETQLDHFMRFNEPQAKLSTGQLDHLQWFYNRYQAQQQQKFIQQSPLRGLIGTRTALIPHQLYIANEVAQRTAPRVLLSDEVGLGKTIEAGLIIHQQLLTHRAQRILIVVPEALQYQWFIEMYRRFNLQFSIFDHSRCEEALASQGNVFDTEQQVITSLQLFIEQPQWQDHLEQADWDLLVIDEAHHLQWHDDGPSPEYAAIEPLAVTTPGLILLTATPEQLGIRSHFARLQLLDPHRFNDFEQFIDEQQNYQNIAELSQLLFNEQALSKQDQQRLSQWLSIDAKVDIDDPQQRQLLIQQLLDQHGTSRVLFRNTRHTVSGFPQRQLQTIPLTAPEDYVIPTAAHSLQVVATPDLYYEESADKAVWWDIDPRIDWLIDLLVTNKTEKFLLICTNVQTVIDIEFALRTKEGIRCALFHQGMTLVERDRAAAYFAQEESSAQILLCSEIGSEGRNFQFVHQLVLFDLPLNPDLLEQRIGRLDRIGQQHDIQLYVPYFSNTGQELLVTWYDQGLDAFSKTCQTGAQLFAQFEEQLILLSHPKQLNTDEMDQLINATQQANQQLLLALESGRDKLLEYHSSGQHQTSHLEIDIAALDRDPKLALFMIQVFDSFGVQVEEKELDITIIKPSDTMFQAQFPELPEEGLAITFSRDTALAQEDVTLLTWDHPMVTGVLEMLTTGDIGNCTVAVLKNKALPEGTAFVELIYSAAVTAPYKLPMQQFFPTTPIRLLLDKQGNDLHSKVSFDQFNQQLKPLDKKTARKLAKALKPQLDQWLIQAKPLAQEQVQSLQVTAKQHIEKVLSKEINRLQILAAKNAAVRPQEISILEEQKELLLYHVEKTQVVLDAIRLVIVSH